MKSKYNDKNVHYRIGRLVHHDGIETYFQQHYSASNTVLELGAGTGIGTTALSTYFHKVIAVEPVTEMLDSYKSNTENANVVFINSDVESLDISRLSFQYIICFQATHWFYETPNYQSLYKKAEKPVIDICSFISFPNDQPFFDELAQKQTIAQSHRGTKYPFEIAEQYSYQKYITIDHAAHQLCSRSWIDHTHFPHIRATIAERYGDGSILVNIETRIHNIIT
ncbi:MAG: class I SAM-dependent methyltransferase [Chloroflexota bacterium]